MASSLYDTGRNLFAMGYFLWRQSGGTTFKVSLIDTDYNPVVGDTIYGGTGVSSNIVGTTATMTIAADPVGGVCDANDVTFTSVTGSTATDNLVIYGSGSISTYTDPLVCWIEYSSVTPNGGDITIQWDSGTNKIFKL